LSSVVGVSASSELRLTTQPYPRTPRQLSLWISRPQNSYTTTGGTTHMQGNGSRVHPWGNPFQHLRTTLLRIVGEFLHCGLRNIGTSDETMASARLRRKCVMRGFVCLVRAAPTTGAILNPCAENPAATMISVRQAGRPLSRSPLSALDWIEWVEAKIGFYSRGEFPVQRSAVFGCFGSSTTSKKLPTAVLTTTRSCDRRKRIESPPIYRMRDKKLGVKKSTSCQ
jgi:hypothetical protein